MWRIAVLGHSELSGYRDSGLLMNIVPMISAAFEAELPRLVEESGESNLQFVLGVIHKRLTLLQSFGSCKSPPRTGHRHRRKTAR